MSVLRRLIPDLPRYSRKEHAASAVGAFVGILATGVISHMAVGAGGWSLPALIAPMGASSVLLFAVPASPLAQPWSIMGGNVVSALIGVAAAQLIPSPFLAAAVAAGLAIAAMIALRCLHPPSGAVALTAVLGGAPVHDLGFGFALWPVAGNSALLLASALAFNALAGRTYPHRPAKPATSRPGAAPSARVGVTDEDLDAALAETGQVLDVGRRDLAELMRRAQLHALGRRAPAASCGDVMSRDVIAVAPGDSLRATAELMRERRLKALPVTDESARVVGIVTQSDMLEKAVWDARGPRLGFGRRMEITAKRLKAPSSRVEDIMTSPVRTLRPESPLSDAAPLLTDDGLHHLPVVDGDGRLAGILAQTDLILALLAARSGPAPRPLEA